MEDHGLTPEQKATNNDTFRHIQNVQRFCNRLAIELIKRGEAHDQSKLEHPEVQAFTEFTPKLAGCTYGSEEYKGYLEKMKAALAHHYAKNRHHPEHFPEGVNDMNILDVVEMLCDWKAATMRHNDGNLRTSIEKNADRFGLSPQLVRIMENSMDLFED